MQQNTNKSGELVKNVGKILEIVSGLSTDVTQLKEGQVRLETRMEKLEKRMDGLDVRMDELTNVVTTDLDWNKEQDKRLDRIEINLNVPTVHLA